ncbi:CsgG/HfaB family protein [Marinirhabdus gelatinilytica]|uniref:Curli biogenesis system outer membrane secretion channel CsgG n=1 Tax=Marinirhabdus gelatinilytica TaxID=1703343 RepID=A0A370Q8N7_9FLAO|nr:CsgG/HfaB family protein [Marinirhabdus gelatinilytica]RDK84726.1 curli biogenesis system outer membrane secretion channel CsgG [Marinirhabdus gelatinilytica]
MHKYVYLFLFSILLSGCGTYFNQPIRQQPARIGELTTKTNTLKEFPLPQTPVVVGVYNFKDQTGQYKSVENGSTFSTAVSQGATTMLIKALEDSKWFTPIERENISHLLNERGIIRSTREEFERLEKKRQPQLPPLLFAGILLEGGIVSYDSNIVTGGLGARYFGVGGSTQYRQDRLTIYLRAVSTSNGKVLKTVYVSKTILSQAIDASLFKFVNFQRLLEVETGITKNEPVQLAMKDAIERAVEALIIEGIQDNLWKTAEGKEKDNQLVEAYLKEKELEESTLLYNRKQSPVTKKNAIHFSAFTNRFNSDFARKPLGYGGSLGYSRQLTDRFGVTLRGSFFQLETGNNFKEYFVSGEALAELSILPYDNLNPYLYGGASFIRHADEENNMVPLIENQIAVIGGVGLKVTISPPIDLLLFAESNYTFNDNMDRVEVGTVNDYFYNFGAGIRYKFGKKKSKTTEGDPENVDDVEPVNEKP